MENTKESLMEANENLLLRRQIELEYVTPSPIVPFTGS